MHLVQEIYGGSMKRSIHKRVLILSDISMPFLTLFIVFIAYICFSPPSSRPNITSTDMTKGWISQDGETLSLNKLPKGNIVLTKNISDIDKYNQSFCLKSSDTWLEIAFDGESAYKYAPKQAHIFGASYGLYVHMVSIPSDAEEITLSLYPIYSGDTAEVRSVCIEDAAVFIADIYHQGMYNFFLCIIIIAFGIVMLIMGLTSFKLNESKMLNFFSLSSFALLVGMWSANDTYLLQTYTNHPEIIKMLSYICIIFIAYPPVSFMASATENKDTKLLPIMVVLISFNLGANMLLSGFGIFDPHDLLILSHINIVAAMFMVVYLMVRAIRRKSINKLFVKLSLTGMMAALVGVTTDMVRFWMDKNGSYGSSPYTQTGVLIFIFLEGAYLIKERGRLAVERERAELMEKMAYTDGLTELANRAAFHEKEAAVREDRQPCFIVQLDINYLKTVNDEYGHAEGDKHIIAAANTIADSFDGVGKCYRTGGDEFIVIAMNSKEEDIKHSLEKLERAADKYNQKEVPPVPLELAYGYAEYVPEKDILEAAEKLADERMYEKKRRMKQAK